MTASTEPDHEQAHRTAYRRARRIQLLDNAGWLATACLFAVAVFTGNVGWLLFAVAGGITMLLWRRYGHLDDQDVREVEACRAEYAAYRARRYADSFDSAPELVDDPHRARLCARVDRIEASLPWWVRTGI